MTAAFGLAALAAGIGLLTVPASAPRQPVRPVQIAAGLLMIAGLFLVGTVFVPASL